VPKLTRPSEKTDHGDDKSTRITRAISHVTGWLGSFPAILLSVMLVVGWVIGGIFVSHKFANQLYQLLINTTTTVVTFVMVFVIQNTQNRDGRAIQAKLDAQNDALAKLLERLDIPDREEMLERLIGVEDAPETEIKAEQEHVRRSARTPNPAA
jgi:low affinity Fe/Cu permease